MDQNLRLIATRFLTDINAAEAALLDAVGEGREAQPLTLSQADIRSGLLEWICADASARPGIHRHGVAMNGFRIIGLIDLIHSELPFPLQFHGCEFTEEVWLKGARLRSLIIRGCRLRGLNADSAQIDTNVLMSEGFECIGEVAFRGATVGGDFRSDGATFSGGQLPTGGQSPALVCDRINVSGGVFLSQPNAKSKFQGEVRFAGADVGGNFDCTEAVFSNPQGAALTAERMKTGGSVLLRESRGCGEINLVASNISIYLDCRGAIYSSPNGRTLNAEKAIIGAHVLLDGEFGCDRVHFLTTTIQGGLRCRLAKIGKLDLRHARVEGPFEWADMIEPSASSVDLRDAHLESIKDDEASLILAL
jgi:hypothetical protein